MSATKLAKHIKAYQTASLKVIDYLLNNNHSRITRRAAGTCQNCMEKAMRIRELEATLNIIGPKLDQLIAEFEGQAPRIPSRFQHYGPTIS